VSDEATRYLACVEVPLNSLTIPASGEKPSLIMLKRYRRNRAAVFVHDVKQTTWFMPYSEKIDFSCIRSRQTP
jgi:hypothetical protein